jgi:hypothetical protein
MKNYHIVLILVILLVIPSLIVFATEKNAQMDHSGHVGDKIHESTVLGYRIAYHLLDLPGREEQHLMVYINDLNGQPVTRAKIGYLIVGPKGVKQKVMAMAMKDSFGGDVNLQAKGSYIIKTKALIGDKKLLDRFTYEIK